MGLQEWLVGVYQRTCGAMPPAIYRWSGWLMSASFVAALV